MQTAELTKNETDGRPIQKEPPKNTHCKYSQQMHCMNNKQFGQLPKQQKNKSTSQCLHPFNGPFPGLPGSAGTRKVKPIWILLKQETVSGSGIS